MLSRNQIKFIQSLRQVKFRKEHGLFIAEGQKVVEELMGSAIDVRAVYAVREWVGEHGDMAGRTGTDLHEVSPAELGRISGLVTPNKVLALCRIPEREDGLSADTPVVLALDGIRDPGNMGTIIRTADWFGLGEIICSEDCVEVWNPKVVQSTMGSIARVKVSYTGLANYLSLAGKPVYATVPEGESIWVSKPREGIFVIGNESQGVRQEVLRYATHRISIPGTGKAESLNASVAAGIIMAALFIS